MLDETIRRVLQLYPRGVTDRQLSSRLRDAGVRLLPDEVLSALVSLSDRGEIRREAGGRWRSALLSVVPGVVDTSRGDAVQQPTENLRAVALRVEPYELSPDLSELVDEVANESGALPDWRQLLAYYAATQRRDPRGSRTEFGDRHGTSWQLISMQGRWWAGAQLHAGMDALPESFREALTKRKIESAAVGWPVTVFDDPKGMTLVPGLLVPVGWRSEGGTLCLTPSEGRPALNPDWVREVRRRTSWGETALIDALFPEGEADDLGSVADRMRNVLATFGGAALRVADLADEVSPRGEGLRNAAALYLPDDAAFTKGAADDLEALSTWDAALRSRTALHALWDTEAMTEGAPALLAATDLTESQRAAALGALRGPLTVIQGPPGTGKSEVILSLVISAVLGGKTVLFASKNHQALDEVERRLRALVGDSPILSRGRDSDGGRDTNLLAALKEIATSEPRAAGAAEPLGDPGLRILLERARAEQALWEDEAAREEAHVELSELAERRRGVLDGLGEGAPAPQASLLSRIIDFIRRVLRRRRQGDERPDDAASLAEIEARIKRLAARLAEPPLEAGRIADGDDARSILRRLAPDLCRPTAEEAARLEARVKTLDFEGRSSARKLTEEDARAALLRRPVWAISALSVPARAPLTPFLFDYVIFDEASQCDIASALPLLARARKAVIVGDSMQLTFIPQLGRDAEHALMDAAGLPKEGRALFAQSANSLFEFAARRAGANRFFLSDQFRSAPSIVDFLSGEFYVGKGLTGRRWEDDLKAPRAYKPGLAWEDVKGSARREDGGTINDQEAEKIAELLAGFAKETGFDGEVGVLSPFNAQVARIERVVRKRLSEAERSRLSLRISTIDRFQGGEADVILFSPVISAGAPPSALTFLQRDRKRLNVAVSRARALCLIVGDLDHAKKCGVKHLARLAERATTPWSPPRAPFDSIWERRLDAAMRARGLEPFPQYPVGTRYLDFALDPEGAKIDVEVDGRRWHEGPDGGRKVADRLRDRELQARGWKVLRFWVHELEQDMGGCLDRIERELGR